LTSHIIKLLRKWTWFCTSRNTWTVRWRCN